MINTDPALPNKNVTVDPQFLPDAFAQIKEIPDPVGSFHGKWFKPIFEETFKPFDTKLNALGTNLPGWLLRPVDSFDKDELSFYETLPEKQKLAIKELRDARQKGLIKMIEEKVIPTVHKQTLAVGSLDVPRYYEQKNKRGCAAANFRMIFEDLTGNEMTEDAIYEAARQNGVTSEETGNPGEVISNENYAKIFQTKAFKDRYPNYYARVIPCWGADLEDITSVLDRIKTKANNPNLKAYCVVSIASEVTQNGWHQVILLSADKNNVYVNDPSNKVGSANKSIPKDDFVRRWGKTFFRSEIVIGIPPIQ